MANPPRTLLSGILLGLTLLSYGPIWNNEFVDFDDEVYLTNNSHVAEGLSWKGVCWAWTNEMAPYWHPLTWLSFQFDYQFFSHGKGGLNPAAFHGQNLFWHCASVLLLFQFLVRASGQLWHGFFVAGLFAVHPMHVESVAWATERKDVLSLFFGILTLWLYTRYTERPGWRQYLCVMIGFLLSLLAKPALLTLPLMLLLLDYWPLRRFQAGKKVAWERLVLEKIPLLAMALYFAVLTLEARERHGSVVPLITLPMSSRVANVFSTYRWYLSASLCPTRLSILYPHPGEDWEVMCVLGGAGNLLGLSVLARWQAKERPWLLVGWLWFVVSLLPVIGLVQGGGQAWADRFCYWPHIGLFVCLVWGAGDVLASRWPPVLPCVAGMVILGVLGAMTWSQTGQWRDTPTLWQHALDVTENNTRAHEHLSLWFHRNGEPQKAASHMDQAHKILVKRLYKR